LRRTQANELIDGAGTKWSQVKSTFSCRVGVRNFPRGATDTDSSLARRHQKVIAWQYPEANLLATAPSALNLPIQADRKMIKSLILNEDVTMSRLLTD